MIKGMVRLFVKGVTKSAVTTTVTLGVFFIGREIGRSERNTHGNPRRH